MNWGFESFAEYMEFIRQRGAYANVAVLVGHSAVRTAVMGEDGSTRAKPTALRYHHSGSLGVRPVPSTDPLQDDDARSPDLLLTQELQNQDNFNAAGILNQALETQSIIPIYNTTGGYGGPAAGTTDHNQPVYLDQSGKSDVSKFNKLLGNVYTELRPLDGLTLRISIGTDYSQQYYRNYFPGGQQGNVLQVDNLNTSYVYTQSETVTDTIDYKRTLWTHNNFDFLEKANIQKASIVFINFNDDTEKLVYIINIKKHFSTLNYVVTLDNGNLKSTFQHAGVTYAISKNEISSKLLASYIYEPDVALFSEEILAYAHEDHEYDMKQIVVRPDNPYAGVFYEKAFFDLKKEYNVVLVGLVKVKDGIKTLLKNPEGSVKIGSGDYLIILLDGKGQSRLKKLFHIEEGV